MSNPSWNAAYVFPDIDVDVFTSFDTFAQHFDSCELEHDKVGLISDERIADFLLDAKVGPICNFYDRSPRAITWYYTVYGSPQERGGGTAGGTLNSIASIVSVPRSPPVYGPVVIVKNAPFDNWKDVDKTVDLDAIVRSLWWYHRSGVDAHDVFGERTLLRYIRVYVPLSTFSLAVLSRPTLRSPMDEDAATEDVLLSFPTLPRDILWLVYDDLTFEELVRLLKMCRRLRTEVHAFLDWLWCHTVGTFGVDPVLLRSVLRSTQSVIGGFAALKFFLHGTSFCNVPTTRLDIYTPLTSALAVADAVEWSTPFTFLYTISSGGRDSLESDEGGATPSAVSPIPLATSTLFMNFLSSDTACAFYPSKTIRGAGLINPLRRWDDPSREDWVTLAGLGFTQGEFPSRGVPKPRGWNPSKGPYYEKNIPRGVADGRCLLADFRGGCGQAPYCGDEWAAPRERVYVGWRFGGVRSAGVRCEMSRVCIESV
ncbi:hypothetical protein OF83DRAFT_1179538 [Amylostereum chailletii]|nr:hypothetical protein OF83DRAFT_1179538 [Amylostereum chailletii]